MFQAASYYPRYGLSASLAILSARIAFWRTARSNVPADPEIRSTTLPEYRHPIYLRLGTSDVFAIDQVFGREEYGKVSEVILPRVIVDCGANIGCTSVYLLNRFPNARLIAIEPDPGNYHICALNLAPYGSRATLMQAAIWSHSTSLCFNQQPYRDGLEWSRRVRPTCGEEPTDCTAIGMREMMAQCGIDYIDLLKIDIEGSEKELFQGECGAWLPQVRTIAIELHDAESRNVFLAATSPYPGKLKRDGEITWWQRIQVA